MRRKLTKLSINTQEITRTSYTKCFGFLLDENGRNTLNIKYAENEITKSTGLIHKAKLKATVIFLD